MDWIVVAAGLLMFFFAACTFRAGRRKWEGFHTYSVVVACRNEEKHLPMLLESLRRIEYPPDNWEIILVDDASTDKTPDLCQAFCEAVPNARWIRLGQKDPRFPGRLGAMREGAKLAGKEIILTTDADCVAPVNWLTGYNQCFGPGVGMVTGYVRIESQKPWYDMQRLSTGCIMLATVGLGRPFTAMGGNCAFTHEAYLRVNGYEDMAGRRSGDDKMMLGKVFRAGYKVEMNRWSMVTTVDRNEASFQTQKRRHGKFALSPRFYQVLSVLLLAFFIYLPVSVLYFGHWPSFLIYFAGMTAFLGCGAYRLNMKTPLRYYFFLLYLPYYFIVFGILGYLTGYRWKE